MPHGQRPSPSLAQGGPSPRKQHPQLCQQPWWAPSLLSDPMACPAANPPHPVFKAHLDPNHVCLPPSTQWSGHPELLLVTPPALSTLVFPTPRTGSPFPHLPQRIKHPWLISAAETNAQCGPGWDSSSLHIAARSQERPNHAAGCPSESEQSAL